MTKMAVGLRRILLLGIESRIPDVSKNSQLQFLRCFCKAPQEKEVKEEFDVLQIYPKRTGRETKAKRQTIKFHPPRVNDMTPEMDWTNIWPGPKTYNAASVPLPVRQGCNKLGAPPARFANTELMKIPNFLHLTPPAIEKHCKQLKKFCTKWPAELEDEKVLEKHFPIEVIYSDYCHSSCSIRDPNARIISLRVKLSNIELDDHAKDKFLRLVGDRYNPSTDYVTITTDSCPIKKQNYNYALYLLTALYFESWKVEAWESMKSEEDMETYLFSQRQSFRNVAKTFKYNNSELPNLREFGKAVENWMNKGDSGGSINQYKDAAKKILGLSSLDS